MDQSDPNPGSHFFIIMLTGSMDYWPTIFLKEELISVWNKKNEQNGIWRLIILFMCTSDGWNLQRLIQQFDKAWLQKYKLSTTKSDSEILKKVKVGPPRGWGLEIEGSKKWTCTGRYKMVTLYTYMRTILLSIAFSCVPVFFPTIHSI